ncbi:type III PLP-dependent enzyme, partial [Escherichia coli]|nr:type III PLP-dependent enzyme [Escherichia coli]
LVMGGQASPFGMDPQEAVRLAAQPPAGVRVRGVHAHLASGLDAATAAVVAREVTDWAVRQVRAEEVNVGGGMAVDYHRPEQRFDWR